jgi:hypothetical protein
MTNEYFSTSKANTEYSSPDTNKTKEQEKTGSGTSCWGEVNIGQYLSKPHDAIRYSVYLEQTTHVRKALLMYGGHGNEPQLARTG